MISLIEPVTFLERSAFLPVVDVRAPVEFAQGHFPGAISIPLFDDHHRAAVGTVYKQAGHDAAVSLGYELANPRRGEYFTSLENHVEGKEILLHCWRGGMRSAEMAKLFSSGGYSVHVLKGGYKAYRRFIRQELANRSNIFVLGGLTGSGKTDLLRAIGANGGQIIDLEHLACHKGSVFGALGQPTQPTNEQFENDLYLQWSRLDHNLPVWMEDESRMIGSVTLPDPVIHHLKNGILVLIEVDLNRRVGRLVSEYSHFDKSQLAAAIIKISERLGGGRTRETMQALEAGHFHKVAEITLAYYDKAYMHSVDQRDAAMVLRYGMLGENFAQEANKLMEIAQKKILQR